MSADGILVLGDVHASDPDNWEALLAAFEAADADAAIQVGDLERYDLPVPTWFVAGNNEDHDVIDSMRSNETLAEATTGGDAAGNAHLLASTAADVAGLRVAGLSGNFAPTQFEKPRADLSGGRRRHFVREDVAAAKSLANVDVLLTHEPPRGFMGSGSEHVDELLDALAPDLCLVGHHHRHAERGRDGTRLVGLAPVWESYYLLDPETLSLERHETP